MPSVLLNTRVSFGHHHHDTQCSVYPRSNIYRRPFRDLVLTVPPITNERPVTTQENHLARCEMTYFYSLSSVAPWEAWRGLFPVANVDKKV